MFFQQTVLNTLRKILSVDKSQIQDHEMETDGPRRGDTFRKIWTAQLSGPEFPSSYGFLATVLATNVCPEVLPTLPWPDEDFLKYTIER